MGDRIVISKKHGNGPGAGLRLDLVGRFLTIFVVDLRASPRLGEDVSDGATTQVDVTHRSHQCIGAASYLAAETCQQGSSERQCHSPLPASSISHNN